MLGLTQTHRAHFNGQCGFADNDNEFSSARLEIYLITRDSGGHSVRSRKTSFRYRFQSSFGAYHLD